MIKSFTFKHCWVHTSGAYTETVFHDGTRVTAVPEESAEYLAKAAAYGYGTDVAALSREHELLHTMLAERLGYGSSPTLWAVAHEQCGCVAPIWEQENEETMVLAFQQFLNGGPPTPDLQPLRDAGFDLHDLRCTLLAELR